MLLWVGGGLWAFRAAEVARLLAEAGAEVRCVLGPGAAEFVAERTLERLSGRAVAGGSGGGPGDPLPAPGERAPDLAIVAPAPPALLRLLAGPGGVGAAGADGPLSAALRALPPSTWLLVLEPEESPDSGPDRDAASALQARGARLLRTAGGGFPEPGEIVAAAGALLESASAMRAPGDLAGVPVLITAGPTREALDPVRFFSNPSTGRMGFALAEAARDRGAQVVLIAGPGEVRPPSGVELVRIVSAEDLAAAVGARAADVRVIVMAAAVSDQRPAARHRQKVKKQDGEELLRLVRTPDILAGLGARFAGAERRPLLVGFAAETEQLEQHAREKLAGKQVDLIVANDVSAEGAGFAGEQNRVLLLGTGGTRGEHSGSKREVAEAIWDEIVRRLQLHGA